MCIFIFVPLPVPIRVCMHGQHVDHRRCFIQRGYLYTISKCLDRPWLPTHPPRGIAPTRCSIRIRITERHVQNGIPKGTKKKDSCGEDDNDERRDALCQQAKKGQSRNKRVKLAACARSFPSLPSPPKQTERRKCKWKFPGGEKKKATRATPSAKTNLSFIPVWAIRSQCELPGMLVSRRSPSRKRLSRHVCGRLVTQRFPIWLLALGYMPVGGARCWAHGVLGGADLQSFLTAVDTLLCLLCILSSSIPAIMKFFEASQERGPKIKGYWDGYINEVQHSTDGGSGCMDNTCRPSNGARGLIDSNILGSRGIRRHTIVSGVRRIANKVARRMARCCVVVPTNVVFAQVEHRNFIIVLLLTRLGVLARGRGA
ncbi:hypothetical protein EDB86DRAFT_2917916 [Lactarius hatsudake]|nr:hypothetical protein EDB86DRAFT_2917916 [Lactarius hatsudake]